METIFPIDDFTTQYWLSNFFLKKIVIIYLAHWRPYIYTY